jgi:hypothetical protein
MAKKKDEPIEPMLLGDYLPLCNRFSFYIWTPNSWKVEGVCTPLREAQRLASQAWSPDWLAKAVRALKKGESR